MFIISILLFIHLFIYRTYSAGYLDYNQPRLYNVTAFQFEIIPMQGYDNLGTVFMGLYWMGRTDLDNSGCYLGLINTPYDVWYPPPGKTVIFRCWHDPVTGLRIEVLRTARNVRYFEFTNECSGLLTYFMHDWISGQAQAVLVKAIPNTSNGYTIFSAYFRKRNKWKFIASMKKYSHYYLINPQQAFIENHIRTPESYRVMRKAFFGCQFYKQKFHGPWREIISVTTSYNQDQERVEQYVWGPYVSMPIDTQTSFPTPKGTILIKARCGHCAYRLP